MVSIDLTTHEMEETFVKAWKMTIEQSSIEASSLASLVVPTLSNGFPFNAATLFHQFNENII
jgi:hypothetical protein